jgi:hypothetical protein
MQIELRNVKHAAFASEETPCFSATVYIDGQKAGEASNEGRGGPHRISPRALVERLDAHAKTLPDIVSDYINDDGQPFSYRPDAESLIGDALDLALQSRDLQRLLKGKAVFVRGGKLIATKKLPAADLARIVSDPQAAAKFKAETCLNALPFDEALALYRKHG